MDVVTIAIGALAAAFGVYTFIMRIRSPEKLGKLEAMQKMLGRGAGTAVHTLAYSVVPVVFGGVMVNAGLNGVSIMEFFAA